MFSQTAEDSPLFSRDVSRFSSLNAYRDDELSNWMTEKSGNFFSNKRTLKHVSVVPIKHKLLFALPFIFQSAAKYFVSQFLKSAFSADLESEFSLSSGLNAIIAAISVIAVPIFGHLSDRISTKRGRRFTVLFATLPIIATGLIAASWQFDAFTPLETTLWFSSFSLLFDLSWRVWNVVYTALGITLTDHYHERTTIFTLCFVSSTCGELAAISIPPVISSDYYPWLAIGVAILFVFSSLFSIFVIPEKEVPAKYVRNSLFVNSQPQGLHFVSSLARASRNPPFALLWCLGILTNAFVFTPISNVSLKYLFQLDTVQIRNVRLAALGMSAASAPIWAVVARRLGKRYAAQIALLGWGVGLCLLFRVPSDDGSPLLWIYVLFVSLCSSSTGLYRSFLADTCDYDFLLWTEHTRMESTFVSLFGDATPLESFFKHLGMAILFFVGFDPTQAVQSSDVQFCIRILLLWGLIPVILSIAILFWYPISAKAHLSILKSIRQRLLKKPAINPLTNKMFSQDVGILEFLNHFSVRELKLYQSKGLFHLKGFILLQSFPILSVGVIGSILCIIGFGANSDSLPTFFMGVAVSLLLLWIQLKRLLSADFLSDFSLEQISGHILAVLARGHQGLHDSLPEIQPVFAQPAKTYNS